jgi:hypothetical protein
MLIEESHRNCLRALQFMPALLMLWAVRCQQEVAGGWALQVFYVCSSLAYIKFFSKYQQLAPFVLDEARNLRRQVKRGCSLGVSAFLLIVMYSHVILRHKALLP